MVQHATTLGADRKCLPRRVRDELLSVAGRLARDGETQLKQSPENPGRFTPYFASLLPRRTPLRISTEPFAEYRETSSVGRVLPWFADGPLLASSPRRKSSGVSKAIAIWALSFTRLEANRNLLTAMSLLPKSIHRCRRYPTKFNSGRDIPPVANIDTKLLIYGLFQKGRGFGTRRGAALLVDCSTRHLPHARRCRFTRGRADRETTAPIPATRALPPRR